MEDYFIIEYTKRKLKEYMKSGSEPELCIKIAGEEYMIIPLKEKISFQWIGKTSEFFYSNVEELFASNLVNQINLNRDWHKVEDIYYC